MQDLLADLRYGLRQLAKHPGFSVVAVLILALGIAVGSSVFSLANASPLRARFRASRTRTG
jgi:hypothetical protein